MNNYSEMYKEGFNARITDANSKLPRFVKKYYDWFDGWYAADDIIMQNICDSIKSGKKIVTPELLK